MKDLLLPSTSYIILPSVLDAHLYAKDYRLFPIDSLSNEKIEPNMIAITTTISNESIRQDCLNIIKTSNIDSLIVKYRGESVIKSIDKSGNETVLDMVENTDSQKVSYIVENVSYAFIPAKKYSYPGKKEDLKEGMLVEFMSNEGIWKEKKVENLDNSYDKMYRLLMKYKKLRY